MNEHDENICTIAFQPEAMQSAAQVLRLLMAGGQSLWGGAPMEVGYAVHVVPVEGQEFDAEIIEVGPGEDGEYVAVFAEWADDGDRGDRSNTRGLRIFSEVDRIEVI